MGASRNLSHGKDRNITKQKMNEFKLQYVKHHFVSKICSLCGNVLLSVTARFISREQMPTNTV